MSLVLGAIADDFTGASDLANNLVRSGMRCLQLIGVPSGEVDTACVDAVVIALKSRSCAPDKAVTESLKALDWLLTRGVKQVFFKYCSTFDSTREGNIGPVSDALLARLQEEGSELISHQTLMVPAFPENDRTVYQGHLFVGDRLLQESGMENHPVTPMKDSDIVRVLSHQTPHRVGLLDRLTLAGGRDAVNARLRSLASRGVRYVVCDTIDEKDLAQLARVAVDYRLLTGGSGLGKRLPGEYRRLGWLGQVEHAGRLPPAEGKALVLAGSCSAATLNQIAHFRQHFPVFALEPTELAKGSRHLEQALKFAREAMNETVPVLIHASANPEQVRAAQSLLGSREAGELVEEALSYLAELLVADGVGRLIVAGGETSGAVVARLGIEQLRIGEQIDPGVPWTYASLPGAGQGISLALKSGNFGRKDIFTRAFALLNAPEI